MLGLVRGLIFSLLLRFVIYVICGSAVYFFIALNLTPFGSDLRKVQVILFSCGGRYCLQNATFLRNRGLIKLLQSVNADGRAGEGEGYFPLCSCKKTRIRVGY